MSAWSNQLFGLQNLKTTIFYGRFYIDIPSSILNIIPVNVHLFRKSQNSQNRRHYLSFVHTSDGDGSGDKDGRTKFHTNSVKRRRNRRERTVLFSSVLSPFYRDCMELQASVSVSAYVSLASVNQELQRKYRSDLPKVKILQHFAACIFLHV